MKKKRRTDRRDRDLLANETLESLDDLLEEAEASVVDILDQSPAGGPDNSSTSLPGDNSAYTGMESTFLALMRSNLKPVTRYVKALSQVKHNQELYEIINLTVSPVAELAARAELFDLSRILVNLSRQCRDAAHHNGDSRARKARRQEIIELFDKLHQRVDLSFRGHKPAVKNLLRFYRRVRKDPAFPNEYIKKFFALGIPSVSWVYRTPETEIVSLSGIPHSGVQRLRMFARRNRKKVGFLNAGLDMSHLARLTTKY
jgi:hypothetical protein